MKVSLDERIAIQATLDYGRRFGYGNLIAHLQTAWAQALMEKYGMDEPAARLAAGGDGYPFGLQSDILERGEWDDTGGRYSRK